MNRFHFLLIFFICLSLPGLLSAQPNSDPMAGSIPLIQTYLKKDLGIEIPQVWSILEAENGMMYFGTTDGILEFDGREWRLITTGGRFSVYRLSMDHEGTIWFGTFNGEFGHLEKDPAGQLFPVVLNGELPDSLNKLGIILSVVNTPNLLWVQGKRQIIAKENGVYRRVMAGKFKRLKTVGIPAQEKWFVSNGAGLCRYIEGNIDTVSGTRAFGQSPARMVALSPRRAILVVKQKGAFLLDPSHPENGINPFEGFGSQVEKFISCLNPSQHLLEDGNWLTPLKGSGLGVYFSPYDKMVEISPNQGLANGAVNSIAKDSYGSYWVGTNAGISRLDFQSPLRTIPFSEPETQNLNTAIAFEGRIYCGGGGVLFSRKPFENWSKIDVGNRRVVPYAFPEIGGDLFVPVRNGIFNLYKEKLIQVETPILQFPVRYPPDSSLIFWGSLFPPLPVFREVREGGVFSHYLKGHDFNSRWLVIEEDGTFWAADQAKGIHRFRLNDALDSIVQHSFFDAKQGLPETANYIVYKLNDLDGKEKVIVTTPEGIYKFDPVSGNFVMDAEFALINHHGFTHPIHQTQEGLIIFQQQGEKGILFPLPEGSYKIEKRPFAKIKGKWSETFSETSAKQILIPTAEGFFFYDPRIPCDFEKQFPVLLRKVIAVDSLLPLEMDKESSPEKGIALSFDQNNLSFHFAALFYEEPERTEFSYWLEGFDADWSDWTLDYRKEYTNLDKGEYRFRVRAKNLYGTVSESEPYHFTILPPWYRTWGAYLIYGLLAFSFIYGVVKFYTRKLVRDKEKLEQIVEERTIEVTRQKDEILQQNQKLIELDDFKQSLTNMIVHDLKNPLNTIIHLPDSGRTVEEIQQSGRQMLNMVTNILDVNKYQDTKMVLDFKDLSVTKVLEMAFLHTGFLAENKGIKLIQTLEGSVGVQSEPEILERIFVNLITNAVKFTPVGGMITISGEETGEFVKVMVKDTGTGIPKDKASLVFAQFGQVEARDSGKVKSTGLGLAFCKMAIEAHGGQIDFDSEEGKGTTFWFTLPKAKSRISASGDVFPEAVIAEEEIELNDSDLEVLREIQRSLQDFEVYEVTDVEHILQRVNFDTEGLESWKKKMDKALYRMDQDLYEKLLQVIK